MSRIGKQPVEIPSGVEVDVDGRAVLVTGPKGALRRDFPDRVRISVVDGRVVVERLNDERQSRALHGLSRALLFNMVKGVSEGFVKELVIVGVGYRSAMRGDAVELQLGFSHPVVVEPPDGISFEVPEPTRLVITGIDKELVGETAARIRRIRPPEPYKGKGIRYVDEYVKRKAGKAGVSR